MTLPALPHLPALQRFLPKRAPAVEPAYLLVAIGTHEVSVGLCRLEEGRRPMFLATTTVPQDPETMRGGLITQLDTLTETIAGAAEHVRAEARTTSDQLVLSLSSALIGGMTSMVHLSRPNAQDKLQEKELQTILNRISQTALADAQQHVAEDMGVEPESLRLVNSAITGISLDGYTLATPIGFSGKDIDVTLFNAYAQASTLVALQQLLTDLRCDLVAITSESYASASTLFPLSAKPKTAAGVLVVAGDDVTSVTVVDKGAIAGSATFGVGWDSAVARLAAGLDVPLAEAATALDEIRAGGHGGARRQKIKALLDKEALLWQHGVRLALERMQDVPSLPPTVYATGRSYEIPAFQAALSAPTWYDGLPFAKQPSIAPFTAETTKQLLDEASQGAVPFTLLALSCLLQTRYQQDPHVAGLFQASIRALE